MQDHDPLWYDREEPPYSWAETWHDLGIIFAAALSAGIIHFYLGSIIQEVSP